MCSTKESELSVRNRGRGGEQRRWAKKAAEVEVARAEVGIEVTSARV